MANSIEKVCEHRYIKAKICGDVAIAACATCGEEQPKMKVIKVGDTEYHMRLECVGSDHCQANTITINT